MSVKKLSRSALDAWVQKLIEMERVYAPQARADRFAYDELRSASDLRLDHDVTILPPKKYFLPVREALLKFEGPAGYQPVQEEEPFILFGVHPYDVAAIAMSDAHFSKDRVDSHYMARRKRAAIVACDVQNPSQNVFAGALGTATVNGGCDIILTLVGDEYLAETKTPRGEEILAAAGELPDADEISLGRRQQIWSDAKKFLQRQKLNCGVEEIPGLLERSYHSRVWERKSNPCYSCGSCTLVCPTCVCFDVQDDVNWDLKSGERVRKWDGCVLNDFALVAGGHNFRHSRLERYRHRFYRKGKYLLEEVGLLGCVGCGRCAGACTTKIANPVELYNALLED